MKLCKIEYISRILLFVGVDGVVHCSNMKYRKKLFKVLVCFCVVFVGKDSGSV